MKRSHLNLRSVVLAWTIFTTTFSWTPTMRLLLKPEISDWNVFGIGGRGASGPFWFLPLVALLALLLFYVEGRGRLRPLFHALLLGWHLSLTGMIVYSSLRHGWDAFFMGAAWKVVIPMPVLAAPFVLFSALAVLLVVRETRRGHAVPGLGWGEVHWRRLIVAGLLLPVATVFFRLGTDFDTMVLIAIVATVVQWILLTEALGPRSAHESGISQPGLRWTDVDLDRGILHVPRSMTCEGEVKPLKTEAGERSLPLVPALSDRLRGWRRSCPVGCPGFFTWMAGPARTSG